MKSIYHLIIDHIALPLEYVKNQLNYCVLDSHEYLLIENRAEGEALNAYPISLIKINWMNKGSMFDTVVEFRSSTGYITRGSYHTKTYKDTWYVVNLNLAAYLFDEPDLKSSDSGTYILWTSNPNYEKYYA